MTIYQCPICGIFYNGQFCPACSFNVQILALGKWVNDGRNKNITFAKAVRRLNKLTTQKRAGRIVASNGEVVAGNAYSKYGEPQ